MRDEIEAAAAALANEDADLVADVDAAPDGPKTAAFFDFDRTVISDYSFTTYAVELIRRRLIGPVEVAEMGAHIAAQQTGRESFDDFYAASVGHFAGHTDDEMTALGEQLWRKRLAAKVYPEVRALIDAHRRKGHLVVLLTSATSYQCEAAAADLGIDHVLCNHVVVEDGVVTGVPQEPIMYGVGKFEVAEAFAAGNDIDLTRSFFYTDGAEEIAFLEEVGNPRPTNPDRKLAAHAKRRGWPVRRFTSRGLPRPQDLARSGLVAGSLAGALVGGLVDLAINRDRRDAVSFSAALLGDLGTAAAGVKVRVVGEEHLWSHRPAVFIFNHQSNYDSVVICKLLRRDLTAVGKKELRSNPLIGPAFAFAGVVFIDRGDRAKAIAALEPVVDTLRNGTSVVIAPEGTRQVTPRPGPFKKGAFVMAMRAGVPIVPIVLANTLDVLPRGSAVVRPATVDVAVLPPIPTDGWTHDGLDDRIAEIHATYCKVLGYE
ncbi:MAG: HAD-IB family hydrolase [Acidimicrobiia bacterium]|nr:HAD-IB family hydrolase [Acidimicrobiia bacterium]